MKFGIHGWILRTASITLGIVPLQTHPCLTIQFTNLPPLYLWHIFAYFGVLMPPSNLSKVWDELFKSQWRHRTHFITWLLLLFSVVLPKKHFTEISFDSSILAMRLAKFGPLWKPSWLNSTWTNLPQIKAHFECQVTDSNKTVYSCLSSCNKILTSFWKWSKRKFSSFFGSSVVYL